MLLPMLSIILLTSALLVIGNPYPSSTTDPSRSLSLEPSDPSTSPSEFTLEQWCFVDRDCVHYPMERCCWDEFGDMLGYCCIKNPRPGPHFQASETPAAETPSSVPTKKDVDVEGSFCLSDEDCVKH
ncbi:MAG: hypothetical protein Q9227_005844, partial [Pyrenula ochraceoflavens]